MRTLEQCNEGFPSTPGEHAISGEAVYRADGHGALRSTAAVAYISGNGGSTGSNNNFPCSLKVAYIPHFDDDWSEGSAIFKIDDAPDPGQVAICDVNGRLVVVYARQSSGGLTLTAAFEP